MEQIQSEDLRFWIMDIDETHTKINVIKSSIDNELIGIVDEKDGGIIAYAIGVEHATLIFNALRNTYGDNIPIT